MTKKGYLYFIIPVEVEKTDKKVVIRTLTPIIFDGLVRAYIIICSVMQDLICNIKRVEKNDEARMFIIKIKK